MKKLIDRWRAFGWDPSDPVIGKLIAAGHAPIAGADGSTDDDDPAGDGGTATATATKDLSEKIEKARAQLVERIGEMKVSGEDKEEVERREKELGKMVDQLSDAAKAVETAEVTDLKSRLSRFEDQMQKFASAPAEGPQGAGAPLSPEAKRARKYQRDNLFLDMVNAVKGRDAEVMEALAEYEGKHRNAENMKAWATGDVEAVDLVLPEIQDALPYLAAAAKVVGLCREIRTSSPSVEFPVYTSPLDVGHHDDNADPQVNKVESDPTFDLKVARVFTIAGTTEVPNSTLEDFPAARGWISSELGRATGVQEERDVLLGDGTGEPLGFLNNTDIPHRNADAVGGASAGRNIITSIFRGAQQVRINGFQEPTDVALNPAVWTDVALSFEDTIGFLYGPVNTEGSTNSGPPLDQPPPRVLGLPITWSSYIPVEAPGAEVGSPIIVGNFNDAIVLRRSPFRIDVDTSLGFRVNTTWFRGEERMGFIVVRPLSFVIVDGVVPSAIS